MSRKTFLFLLLMISLGITSGCGKKAPADVSAMTLEEVSADAPDLDILTLVQIEAGCMALTEKDLFSPYDGQSVVFERELSVEELSFAGQIYEVPVLYQDQSITISVEIIDTIPPVLEGIEDLTVTEGESLSYKKNVLVTDNSSQEVTLEIDNSRVDLNTPGTYLVRYTATDASGNTASADITVTVNRFVSPAESEVLKLANDVIADIITEDMSLYDKAYALWLWCCENISYSYSDGDRTSVWTGAYEGLHDRSGDCYAYYATYAVLLDCCEIPNLCVERVGGDSRHWWNLVNTGDGWYHCDASPRSKDHPYYCFMQTDAQVQAYTESYPEHPNYYTFDSSLYPQRATTIIYEY